jgi:hypothetical protein
MRGFHLNTWQWIAIVLSVLGAIGAWLNGMNSSERVAETISTKLYDDCVFSRSDTGEDCSNTRSQARDFQMALGRKQATARAILPIPIWWMVIWLVNRIVLLVRRGFQPAARPLD